MKPIVIQFKRRFGSSVNLHAGPSEYMFICRIVIQFKRRFGSSVNLHAGPSEYIFICRDAVKTVLGHAPRHGHKYAVVRAKDYDVEDFKGKPFEVSVMRYYRHIIFSRAVPFRTRETGNLYDTLKLLAGKGDFILLDLAEYDVED